MNRNYAWNFDVKSHVFGKSNVSNGDGVFGCMKPANQHNTNIVSKKVENAIFRKNEEIGRSNTNQ